MKKIRSRQSSKSDYWDARQLDLFNEQDCQGRPTDALKVPFINHRTSSEEET